jgi:DNA-binding transcriptional LysR family regulator
MRDKPAGTIRITAGEHPAGTILWPALERLLPDYPEIKVEIMIDCGLTDIVAERYDAGVRLGEQVAKGMIAVRIAPPCAWPWLAPHLISRAENSPKIQRT